VILSILIPAYNEERTIGELLAEVWALKPATTAFEADIIVINDGSTDRTDNIIRGFMAIHPPEAGRRMRYLALERNEGKSAALQEGMKLAEGEVVIFQDADLELSPRSIAVLLDRLVAEGHPAVFGSRFLMRKRSQTGIGWIGWWGNRTFTELYNLLYGQRITDLSTGYKMLTRERLSRMRFHNRRFGICAEIASQLARDGRPIPECAVEYDPRSPEQGKKLRLRDAFEILQILFYRRWRPL
jgi:dolichol-phosphate mannosyltransferase